MSCACLSCEDSLVLSSFSAFAFVSSFDFFSSICLSLARRFSSSWELCYLFWKGRRDGEEGGGCKKKKLN